MYFDFNDSKCTILRMDEIMSIKYKLFLRFNLKTVVKLRPGMKIIYRNKKKYSVVYLHEDSCVREYDLLLRCLCNLSNPTKAG